jgi:adenylate cyclase
VIPLESLTSCFQGLIPAWLCTCSRDGIPNVAILSHVDYVDSRHVALSFQFFNKSKRNIVENPKAMVRLYDPDTMQAYALKLRFVRTETEGPTFSSMRLRIEAIASYSGLKGVFRLLGADVYEVLSVTRVEDEAGLSTAPAKRKTSVVKGLPFTMKALQEFSDSIQQAVTLDALLDSILETLERIFGLGHSMILLATERSDRLEAIASRGYPKGGIGSEVGFGEGIIGMVAEARKPIRIAGMLRQMLYANAVAKRAQEHGIFPPDRRIPLPGLADPESQLGIPLLVRDELIGVLCIETERSYRFHEEDRAYVEVLGTYLAIAIQNMLLQERAEESNGSAAADLKPARSTSSRRPRLEINFYKTEECILVDGEYLVRSLPASILWNILQEHRASGCIEFTNRRLRLNKALNLPAIKDNLETRLILLRRRLEERCPEIRIAQSGRGRFRLELETEVALVEHP